MRDKKESVHVAMCVCACVCLSVHLCFFFCQCVLFLFYLCFFFVCLLCFFLVRIDYKPYKYWNPKTCEVKLANINNHNAPNSNGLVIQYCIQLGAITLICCLLHVSSRINVHVITTNDSKKPFLGFVFVVWCFIFFFFCWLYYFFLRNCEMLFFPFSLFFSPTFQKLQKNT